MHRGAPQQLPLILTGQVESRDFPLAGENGDTPQDPPSICFFPPCWGAPKDPQNNLSSSGCGETTELKHSTARGPFLEISTSCPPVSTLLQSEPSAGRTCQSHPTGAQPHTDCIQPQPKAPPAQAPWAIAADLSPSGTVWGGKSSFPVTNAHSPPRLHSCAVVDTQVVPRSTSPIPTQTLTNHPPSKSGTAPPRFPIEHQSHFQPHNQGTHPPQTAAHTKGWPPLAHTARYHRTGGRICISFGEGERCKQRGQWGSQCIKVLRGKKKSDKGINRLREYIIHSPVIQILP